jgi:hypothetical protein
MDVLIADTQRIIDDNPTAYIQIDVGSFLDTKSTKPVYFLPSSDFQLLYTFLHRLKLQGTHDNWQHQEVYTLPNNMLCCVSLCKNITAQSTYRYTVSRMIVLYTKTIMSKNSSVAYEYKIMQRQCIPAYLQTNECLKMTCRLYRNLVHTDDVTGT